MAAAKLALQEGKIDPSTFEPTRFGVLISSGIGGIETTQNQDVYLLSVVGVPVAIPSLIANIAGGLSLSSWVLVDQTLLL